MDSVTDSQKRREILSRRPSYRQVPHLKKEYPTCAQTLFLMFACLLYRKILNDLSSDAPAVPRIEEEKSEDDSAPTITTVTMPTPIYQTSSGQYSKCLFFHRDVVHRVLGSMF